MIGGKRETMDKLFDKQDMLFARFLKEQTEEENEQISAVMLDRMKQAFNYGYNNGLEEAGRLWKEGKRLVTLEEVKDGQKYELVFVRLKGEEE